MTTLFSTIVELGSLRADAKALSWATAKGPPLLAIAASTGGVALVNEEGKHMEQAKGEVQTRLSIQSKRRDRIGASLRILYYTMFF